MIQNVEVEKPSGWLIKLLILALAIYGLHWFVVSLFATATISECKPQHRRFNSDQCQCIKGKLKGTLEVELYLFDSINDRTDTRLMVSKLLRVKNGCTRTRS